MKLHTTHRDFKVKTPEIGAVLDLMSEKLDTGMDFDKFRETLKVYMERNIENLKDVLCVVTDTEDPMKCFEEDKTPKDLDEYEAKSILK